MGNAVRGLEAVILNKATSLVVVGTALPFRAGSVPITTLGEHWPIIVNLLAGSLIGAWAGAEWATRLKSETLYRVIAVLLLIIAGVLLLAHDAVAAAPPFMGWTKMMNAFRFFADAGGLMTYGATASEIYKSAAEQVATVLGGVRPSELPLRQATRFELVINNWTAKALGIAIPPSLLARADEVIESPPPFATH